MNTIVSTQHADLGMPVSGRVRMASPCILPLTGVASAAAGQTSAFGVDASWTTYVTTDIAVLEGAFPGTASWSPPI